MEFPRPQCHKDMPSDVWDVVKHQLLADLVKLAKDGSIAAAWASEIIGPSISSPPATEEWLIKRGFRDDLVPGWFKWGRVLIIHDSNEFNTAWIKPCAVYDLNSQWRIEQLCSVISPLPER